MTDLTDQQIERYSRHILLPEVGGIGQERLLAARVLVVGAGGLGAPLLLYLAAAGVGTLGIADDDVVDLSNLQRQVIHDTGSIGENKVESAARRVRALNADVTVETHARKVCPETVDQLVGAYDVVADGTDTFAARYMLNDACYRAGRTLVSAALLRFEGQISTYKAFLGPPHPCYRCIFNEAPPPGSIPSCSEAGVLGSLAGLMGSLQATEVLKELLGIGESLSGRLVMIDALAHRYRTINIPRDPECPLCGQDRPPLSA